MANSVFLWSLGQGQVLVLNQVAYQGTGQEQQNKERKETVSRVLSSTSKKSIRSAKMHTLKDKQSV